MIFGSKHLIRDSRVRAAKDDGKKFRSWLAASFSWFVHYCSRKYCMKFVFLRPCNILRSKATFITRYILEKIFDLVATGNSHIVIKFICCKLNFMCCPAISRIKQDDSEYHLTLFPYKNETN